MKHLKSMEITSMKIVSIKRLVLSLIFTLGSVMTLPAHAWPDTDEMNMCGAAVKQVRAQGANFGGWAAHDVYISQRGLDYYYRTNCPQSKATKNYKGKDWTPGAKMSKKRKVHKKRTYKARKTVKKVHNKKYNKTKDCIAVDRLNNSGPVVRKINNGSHNVHDNFYRNAQSVLNMGKAKKYKAITKKTNNDYCVVTNGLNTSGAAVRVVNRKHF